LRQHLQLKKTREKWNKEKKPEEEEEEEEEE
jgi:hypothetical protein